MDYREFLNAAAEALQNRIDGKYRVMIDSAGSPSQDKPVLRVIDKRSGVAFTVPTEGAFEKLKDGMEMDEVIAGIAGHVNRGIREMPAVDTSVLDDYRHMLGRIRVQMVPKAGNSDMLQGTPHIDMLDMAAVFRVMLSREGEDYASVIVKNSLLRRMNVTPEHFVNDALAAAENNHPIRLQRLTDFLLGTSFETRDESEYMSPLVFAGTDDRMWGSGVIAYPDFMKEAAEKLDGNFFLLPSSIHEVLLLPDDGDMDPDFLKNLVASINETEVSPEEKLTDNAYHYDAKERVFDTVDHYREHEKQHSVLKDLNDRKAEIRENSPVPAPLGQHAHAPVL